MNYFMSSMVIFCFNNVLLSLLCKIVSLYKAQLKYLNAQL